MITITVLLLKILKGINFFHETRVFESMIVVFFKVIFTQKNIPIIFFLFLKIIFEISTLK
jgi:hypothetical protein